MFAVLRAAGAIAQLGERLLCKQEVVGSIPSGSTKFVWSGDRSSRLPLELVHEIRIRIAAIERSPRRRLSDIVKRRSIRKLCAVMSCV